MLRADRRRNRHHPTDVNDPPSGVRSRALGTCPMRQGREGRRRLRRSRCDQAGHSSQSPSGLRRRACGADVRPRHRRRNRPAARASRIAAARCRCSKLSKKPQPAGRQAMLMSSIFRQGRPRPSRADSRSDWRAATARSWSSQASRSLTRCSMRVFGKHSCAEGVCGTCETRVIDGIPDHRDLFLSPEEQAANKTIMICCSGSKSGTPVLDL